MLPVVEKQKRVLEISSIGIALNLILFAVKLYIGLAANSISIFSDGINNLADSLSCILAVVFMVVSLNNQKNGNGGINAKMEQLLSFLLSLVVFFVGFYFFYSSIERLMYPTPIWFTELYLYLIIGTVGIKVFMALMYHFSFRSSGSQTLKVMRTDSILDIAITSVTILSFFLTQYTEFTVDAFSGIAISIFILVQAVLLIKTALGGLINYVKKETRDGLRQDLENLSKIRSMNFEVVDDMIVCYVAFDGEVDIESAEAAGKRHDVKLYIVAN